MPSCASKELLNDNMRSKWGFNGYMCAHLRLSLHSVPQQQPSLPATRSTSDCGAVGNANYKRAGLSAAPDMVTKSLEAGLDTDCGNGGDLWAQS